MFTFSKGNAYQYLKLNQDEVCKIDLNEELIQWYTQSLFEGKHSKIASNVSSSLLNKFNKKTSQDKHACALHINRT